MRKKWHLRKDSDTIIIVRRLDLFPEELDTIHPQLLIGCLDRWLADPLAAQVMLDMHQCFYGRSLINRQSTDREELRKSLRGWLEHAFRCRQLVAVLARELENTHGTTDGPEQSKESAPAAPQRSQHERRTTWIEIELVDALGTPVPFERFRLEAPDGIFHEGQLDAQGQARVDSIEPGICELNFPDRDLREWRAA